MRTPEFAEANLLERSQLKEKKQKRTRRLKGSRYMLGFGILSWAIFFPLIGASLILLTGRREKHVFLPIFLSPRWVALISSLITLLLCCYIWKEFDPTQADFQFVETHAWVNTHIHYKVGIDGIGLPFLLLTAALTPLCVLASWESIDQRVQEYFIAFLILETLLLGVFVALDIVLFYLFFEGSLIPMFLIIGMWGGKNRIYAAFKFFLYTFLGSVFMLLAIMAMISVADTGDMILLLKTRFPETMQFYLWLAFFASFAVKMPMFPVHTWLPDAHVEAPTGGSVILAGVLLKMGGYGFLRFSLPMFPLASHYFTPLVTILSVIAIVYTSLIAFVQEDVKKLIAYSSVAHMGFVTLGLFSGQALGVEGAIFQMISHGFISSALFLCVGVIYDRTHTRDIAAYSGLAKSMPRYAVFFMVFTLGNLGLPGTSGFVGEFLTLLSAFQTRPLLASLAATGIVLSAVYGLWLCRALFFGPALLDKYSALQDLTKREGVIFIPLLGLTLYYGLRPDGILNMSAQAVAAFVTLYNSALIPSKVSFLL